jgi:hypothetical protein
MGVMRRTDAGEADTRRDDRFASTVIIAVAIIAAVRLARDDISRPSPGLYSVVAESIAVARMILSRVTGSHGAGDG